MKCNHLCIGACVFQNGFTPLHLASQEGHTDIVSLLLEKDANVNARAHVSCLNIVLFCFIFNLIVVQLFSENMNAVSPFHTPMAQQ